MKKLAVFIIFVMFFQSVAFAHFDDVATDSVYHEAIGRLVSYGVISGKGNNLFDPYGGLTRAEMAKIATTVAGLGSEAVANSETSLFSDIQDGFWATGYVNIAAKNQIILGYPDGTFAPQKQLTYAEAVTILLRLLGYGTQELGNNWPYAYMAKAREIGLLDGQSSGDFDFINRANIALVIDRALLTDMNNAQEQTAKKLIELMDFTVTPECIILATSQESKNLLSDEINTTLGTYKRSDDSVSQYVTRKVKLILNKDNKVVNVLPLGSEGKNVIIQSVVDTELAYTVDGRMESIRLGDNSIVYYQGVKKTFSEAKSVMDTGMTMAVYYSPDGTYDYSVIKDFEMLGPFVITADFTGDETYIEKQPLERQNLRIIRDGFDAELSDIKALDVAYYNAVSNIIYVYCDKVSGVYEEALPSKASVTKIVLSGAEYQLETQRAAQLLGEHSGAYKLNDYITLLLGKDGKVVSVVNVSASEQTVHGVILSSGTQISQQEQTKGSTQYYIEVFTVNGLTQTFITDKDYTQYRGRVIKYNFKDGLMVPQLLQQNSIEWKIDRKNNMIGGFHLSKDVKLVDLVYSSHIKSRADASAKMIDFSEIPYDSLSKNDVLFAYVDPKFNEIQFIVFNNITLSRYQFGMYVKDSRSGITLNIKGEQTTYSGKKFAPQVGQAIMANIQGNSLLELKALTKLSTSGTFEAINIEKIRIGGENYPLAPDFTIFKHVDFNYLVVSLDDIESYDIGSISIYADTLPKWGGLVRVVVFTPNTD
ncbi:MAG: S-layer homology domain-containing protein [Clostridiaceae bacterium]|nr:S-layer homology domain-containing protein [Clostridiaceae bacterium]